MTMHRQCELLRLPRSSAYYEAVPESRENLRLMKRIDRLYLAKPFFGSRRISLGLEVNRKRLMQLMGIQATYPKPRTTRSSPEHKKYPYLLREMEVK